MTLANQKAPANSVPAAAVIRGGLVLFAMTGRKAYVGRLYKTYCERLGLNLSVTLSIANSSLAEVNKIFRGGVQSMDTERNTRGEGDCLGQTDAKVRKRR